MAKIELKFAELHTALFLCGKNHGMKLDPTKQMGLSLIYDRGEKELLVGWSGQEAIIPLSNVVSMTAGEPKRKPAVVQNAPVRPTAQVSTPTSHVFAGEGHGDTGLAKPTGKVVL